MKPTALALLAAAVLVTFVPVWLRRRTPSDDAARRARVDEMYRGYREQFPGVPEIEATELLGRLGDEDLVLVDVRDPGEQAISMLPGAIPVEELERRADELGGRTVVTYCTIGLRSGRYARALRERGVDAWNLEGSLLAWTHAGGPLVGPDGPTKRVHVYGARWDLARTDYEATW